MQSTQEQRAPAQVRLERHYPVAVEKVWRAWTEPQALSRWFNAGKPGAVSEAEIDLRVGGRYRIVTRMADGQTNDVGGEYLEIAPQRRLVFSWAWHSTPDRVSRVSIDLSAQDGGTTPLFVHDRFFDEQARVNHERGWLMAFEHIDRLLTTPQEA
ncbi:SRPBCC family protein [Roseateles sp. P5_E7]